MKYIGHSKVYYQGSNGYKLCSSDDGSFYSIYFDSNDLPVIRILSGEKNVISRSGFKRWLEMDFKKFYNFDADIFIVMLLNDLEDRFDLKVEEII